MKEYNADDVYTAYFRGVRVHAIVNTSTWQDENSYDICATINSYDTNTFAIGTVVRYFYGSEFFEYLRGFNFKKVM